MSPNSATGDRSSEGRTRAPVEIDRGACRRLADALRGKAIPVDSEETGLPGFTAAEVTNFYLFLVAVCHQTSPRGRPPLEGFIGGRHLRGWDYLLARFEAASRADASLLAPERWEALTAEDFAGLFTDPVFGERLTEPAERAALVRDLGRVMIGSGWSSAGEIYDSCGGRVASGEPNLLGALARFRAYRDPVRKKSFFFLALMRNSGLWGYADEENLGPPVDYHEVRGHLRLGTVAVRGEALRHKLVSGLPVTAEEDVAIRQAVFDAIMFVSDLTGLRNPSQLHYLFWNVFRSCCPRESPHCLACPPTCPLPERYVHLAVHPDGGRRCPFAALCADTCATTHAAYYEHVFETDYY